MKSIFLLLLMVFAEVCQASGGTGEYALPWAGEGEVLMYHSCGCADSCWVAEVRVRGTDEVRGRLSCDCQSLAYAPDARGPATSLHESCEPINESSRKAELIKQKLEGLRDHNASAVRSAKAAAP